MPILSALVGKPDKHVNSTCFGQAMENNNNADMRLHSLSYAMHPLLGDTLQLATNCLLTYNWL